MLTICALALIGEELLVGFVFISVGLNTRWYL